MADSIASRVAEWAGEIETLLRPLATGELRDLNADWRSSRVAVITSPYSWSELSTDGLRFQSRALEEFRRFSALVRVLTREQASGILSAVDADTGRVTAFIERNRASVGTPERALDDVLKALRRLVAQIDKVFSASDGALLVPDTNALYWNPALEEWRHPTGPPPFAFVLTPQVLSEIDLHKDDSRNATRREKAKRLVRQIGEYRRRGRLSNGVPIVTGISTIMSVATEPRLPDSLPWLDATSADDRFLASGLEVMRQNVRADVVVVTRDVNLQNKLDFAHLPSADPSEFVNAAAPDDGVDR